MVKIGDLFAAIPFTKKCTMCGEQKPHGSFYKNTGGGLRSQCIPCYAIHNKQQREKHRDARIAYDRSRGTGWDRSGREKYEPTKREKHDSYLKRTYNITIEEYDEMLSLQNGVCAICGNDCNRSTTLRLCVDHCHSSGNVRGLLCFQCNVGLGKFKDSIIYLRSAISYLEKNSV